MFRHPRICFKLLFQSQSLSYLILISTVVLVVCFLTYTQVFPSLYIKKNDPAKVLQQKHYPTKYLLLWGAENWSPFYYFTVKDILHRSNCYFKNCKFITNEYYFGDEFHKFHAVAFNGRLEISNLKKIKRWPHQKFIYFNTESSAMYPIEHKEYDGLFNWTSTYRLDSDIPYPYLIIRNRSGHVVGPRIHMEWKQDMTEIYPFMDHYMKKKKVGHAAIIFLSNCGAKSNRDRLTYGLYYRLAARGYKLDIYGQCGPKICLRKNFSLCNNITETYYFYLAFENAFAEDYITEKVLRAFHRSVVPIVFGGANYSRFLPPKSYINAKHYDPDDLVDLMIYLINNPKKYVEYFNWRRHYSYYHPFARENVCRVCRALNDKKYETHSVYEDFGKWWNH